MLLVLLANIVLYTCGADALRCLSCYGVISPIHCHRIRICDQGDVCVTEEYENLNGERLYNVGCQSSLAVTATCRVRSLGHVTDQGIIDPSRKTSCTHCCGADLCNAAGCGSAGYPRNRGPVCFSCGQTRDPELCTYIQGCDANEICFIEEVVDFGEKFYTSSCRQSLVCHNIRHHGQSHLEPGQIVGRRRRQTSTDHCSYCCQGDLCNHNCSQLLSPTAPQTSAGSTSRPTTVTSLPPIYTIGEFNCTFDDGPCGWKQDNRDQFNWTRNSGSTGSTDTGPNYDHTTGTNNGSYYYIEASSPRVNGDKARFISPEVMVGQYNSQQCLSFWYNMFGSEIDTLNVYLKNGSRLGTPIFTKVGNQSASWIKKKIDLSSSVPYQFQVVIEARRGTGYYGDIAIDDVAISNGPCQNDTPRNCQEISMANNINGTFTIEPVDDQEKNVTCQQGGWTVIQQRRDGSVDFYRTWQEYKEGFGSPSTEYWLGNDAIHALTMSGQCELRIEMINTSGEHLYALYRNFTIEDESHKYILHISGYSGTAGDFLTSSDHNGQPFSTRDQDNDVYHDHCARLKHAGYWYGSCNASNLNGNYKDPQCCEGFYWSSSRMLKQSKMMVRCRY